MSISGLTPAEILANATLQRAGANGSLVIQTAATNALVKVPYDYIAATYPTTASELYTYKVGGSSGATVAAVTVTYTDDTKTVLSSVGVS